RHSYWADSQRREAVRAAGRSGDQVRTDHQPQDCQGARARGAADASRPRRRGDRMRRRQFITLLGGAAALPLAAPAQQPERMRRVGVLLPFTADDSEGQARLMAFAQGLQQLGWTVGTNLRIDARWGAGDAERIRKYAAELLALTPDVFVANGSPEVSALR